MLLSMNIQASPVGESTHADPDSLEHTVASQLVHDQWGLHLMMAMMMMVMMTMVIMMMI